MPRTVRYERLRPDELRAELARCPVCYIPFGPIEWHGPQSAMGLDALNAETIALRSAELYGGRGAANAVCGHGVRARRGHLGQARL